MSSREPRLWDMSSRDAKIAQQDDTRMEMQNQALTRAVVMSVGMGRDTTK